MKISNKKQEANGRQPLSKRILHHDLKSITSNGWNVEHIVKADDISTHEMICKILELCDNEIKLSPSDAVRDEIIRLRAHVQAFYETEAIVKVMNHCGGVEVTTTIEGELRASHIPFDDRDKTTCESKPSYDDEMYALFVYPPSVNDYFHVTWATWAVVDTARKRGIVECGTAIDFITRCELNYSSRKGNEEDLRKILGIDKWVKSEYIDKQLRIQSIQNFSPGCGIFNIPYEVNEELLAFIERGALKEDNSSQTQNTEVYDEKK
jgi:hypothetical protein